MRREFPAKVKVLAFNRAKGCCQKCGGKLYVGKTRTGFVIVQPRNVGLGRIKAIPFFRHERWAKDTADRWHSEKLTVCRATLTLHPPKQKKAPKK